MARMWIPLSPDGKDDTKHKGTATPTSTTSPHPRSMCLRDLIRDMESTGWYSEWMPMPPHDFVFQTYASAPPSYAKLSYPLLNYSRQSILLAQESKNHSCILILQLEQYKVLVIDHCIQCRLWTGDPLRPALPLESPNRALYEFMSHIPMCSVRPEPFYILILNTRPNATTTTTLEARNDNLLMGYAILLHLIQGYKSLLYKVVFVEEDPLILQVWQEFWQDHASFSGILQDDCVEVVTANPRSFLQNLGQNSRRRYQVIFVTHDFHEEDDDEPSSGQIGSDAPEHINEAADPSTEDPWNLVYQSLVPGGVACTLSSLDPGATKQAERQVHDPSWTIEYAQLPGSFLHPTTRLLRLYIRDSTNGNLSLPEVSATTCRSPVREPIRTDDAMLGWPEFYSPATHRTAFVLPPCLQDYQSQVPDMESEIRLARPSPIIPTDENQKEDSSGTTHSQSGRLACLEHHQIAAALSRILQIPSKENALVPESSIGESDRENGPPLVPTEESQTEDNRGGHLACLEHHQIAAVLSKLFRIPIQENALVPASNVGESDRENGPQHRLFTATRAQECFSIFPKPSCVIQ